MPQQILNNQNMNNHKKACSLAKKVDDLFLKNDFKSAHFYMQKLKKIILNPNASLLELEARIEFNLGDEIKATRLIDKAISLTQNDSLHTTKGLFYTKMNRFDEAINEFEKSLTLNNHNNPSILYIAEIYLLRLKINDAYLLLRQEKSNLPSYQEHWKHIFNRCLSNIKNSEGIPLMNLYTDINEFFNDENSTLDQIGNLCYALILVMQDQLNVPLPANQLLLTCLGNGIICNCELELALCKERKRILQTSLSQLNIPKNDLPLASALAANAYYNEYIVYYDQHEKIFVQQLKEIIHGLAREQTSVAEISGFLLLYIMYESINNLDINSYIEDHINEEWPEVISNIIQWSLINPQLENKLKSTLTLLEVTDDENLATTTSSMVQQQYEENPYPRWVKLQDCSIPLSYTEYNKLSPDTIHNINFFNSTNQQILVAGCGTGQHPIQLARTVRDASITALDFCKSSLAYAQRMANEYEVENIQFIYGDILNLAHMNKKFHIIESVGVLHHLENPENGLQVLCNIIMPGGIIKIGLYSSMPRKKITQLRQANQSINMSPTKENIQAFRHAVLNNPESEYHCFTNFTDFYSTSGCRDLLFHEQEHTYTIPQLKILLEKYHLRFLGFSLRHQVLEHYKSLYPDDPNTVNLDNWHTYEQQYPKTFQSMYQFHCQAIE